MADDAQQVQPLPPDDAEVPPAVDDAAPDAAAEAGAVDEADAAADSAASEAEDAAEQPPGPRSWKTWRQLWQVPALVLSVWLIVLALSVARQAAPGPDFDGALDSVDHLIDASRFDEAMTHLADAIEPNLHLATNAQRGRFHALISDWVQRSLVDEGVYRAEDFKAIADNYRKAVQYGWSLQPVQTERWAMALIELNDLDGARLRLDELEALAAAGEDGDKTAARRNRVMRRLAEAALAQRGDDVPTDRMELLATYRSDPQLPVDDEAWAIARQAELRLADGRPSQAVDRLLIDMRRLEDAGRQRGTSPASAALAELYVLLARGYMDLGRVDDALFQLQRAQDAAPQAHPVVGQARMLEGRVHQGNGEIDAAFERFDAVVRDYPATEAHLPARLGRAEVYALLGEREASLDDYREVIRGLPAAAGNPFLTADAVRRSLLDRHDAAAAMGHYETALSYARLAESMSSGDGDADADVLLRLATTERSLAEAVLAEAVADDDDAGAEALTSADAALRISALSPAQRHEAQEHFHAAARHATRYVDAVEGRPALDEQWADALWLAADSFDLAGRHDRAVEAFRRYIDHRPDTEPRRSAATWRLAQAHHALLDWEQAAQVYEQVIREHPRSMYATQSHVPLAQCYLALGREPEAEQQLQDVLAGRHPVRPGSIEYREALIALGRLYYDAGEYDLAVEHLDRATRLYPDDQNLHETLFWLADSYRNLALAVRAGLDAAAAMTPSERRRQAALADEHFTAAASLFSMTMAMMDERPAAGRDALQETMRRNAHLYRADCQYYLGDFAEAARLYDEAARRYHDHHASMHALVQIVNCYERLGDEQRARSAHQRALVRLRQLPDEAFNAPDSLMTRTAWEQWLTNRPVAPQVVSAAEG